MSAASGDWDNVVTLQLTTPLTAVLTGEVVSLKNCPPQRGPYVLAWPQQGRRQPHVAAEFAVTSGQLVEINKVIHNAPDIGGTGQTQGCEPTLVIIDWPPF